MAKLVSMKAKKSKDGEPSGPDGVRVHLDHDHIKAMGMDTPLSHGTAVTLHGEGEVTDSGTHEDMDGNPRHTMTITLHKAGMDGDEDKGEGDRGGIRKAIKDASDAVEAKKANKAAPGRVFNDEKGKKPGAVEK